MTTDRYRWALIALAVVAVVLSWWAPLDKAANTAVDEGLKRSLVTFATARAANAALSIAESAQVGFSAGLNGNLTVGKILAPVNHLIEQFSEVMLAASVAFGLMKLALVVGEAKVLSALLTVLVAGYLFYLLRTKPVPRWLTVILLLTFLIRFAVPAVTVGSEATFKFLFADTYKASQTVVSSPSPPFPGATAVAKSPDQYLGDLKQWAERWIEHSIKLIALFLFHTLLVPGLLLWGFVKGTRWFADQGKTACG
jgi:hypothetical protein